MHTITANYNSSGTFLTSSGSFTQNVAEAGPSLNTSAGPTVVYGGGVPLTESATLSGSAGMTGSITFTLRNPRGVVVDTESATVNGPGTYHTPSGYLPRAVGTYQWSASYSGDANDKPAFGRLGVTPASTLTGLYDIYGVAIDAAGNRYVAESLPNRVAVFAPGSTSPTSFLTGVTTPTGLVFDPAGNLFVHSGFSHMVWKFTPGSTMPTATLSGLNQPLAPAVDPSGDLFVSNGGNNTISEFAPGSITPTATLTGLSGPGILVVDASGDMFVGYSNNTVSEFAAGSTTPTATLTGLNHIISMASDAQGDLYVANYGSATVSEFTPATDPEVVAPATLTVTATAVNKVYDGTTAATVTLSDNRVSGDMLTVSYTSAAFADKNVGTAKAVSVNGISISGADAANYTVNTTASTTANITPRALTLTAATNTKTYDGTTSATATPTVTGLQGSDSVTGRGRR
jgi:hypothetical protein